ncbi:helix-turn-helix domain-containing protein [Falsihalocynthiibacter arcticus]|uniref:HTH cro/C1-type domain-containing protein n=1 Tax=Falsihalocynthiibacter arcticus TaxID=1579316 RepID=A0A126UX34_9RHOB|nr:helix-turn-helix transcriptional regulator [Falsihalocynthiibacter arcticus]AML50196.1 hypothetical protein RC74_01965 [Falsihalocynthiibacter arcticus]
MIIRLYKMIKNGKNVTYDYQKVSEEMDLLELGELVRAARKEKKMTQETLSMISGVSRPTISAFEKGGMFDMNFSTVQKLVEGVGLTLRAATANRGRPTYEELMEEKGNGYDTSSVG